MADFEAIVVDNGSQDNSLKMLVLPDHRFRLLPLGKNLGFAAANNAGAAVAQGSWLATLNPDAFPEPDWLENLLDAAHRHPSFALFGSTQVLDDDPEILDGSGDAYSFLGLAWRGNYLHPLCDLPPEGEVFSPCAAAAMYRADVFRELGGFDESLFCYCEDVDLGFRFRLRGHRCLQVSGAVVRHVSGGISGRQSPLAFYLGHRNSLWVHIKNMPWPLLLPTLPLHLAFELLLMAKFQAQALRAEPEKRLRLRLQLFAHSLALRHGLLRSRRAWQRRREMQEGRTLTVLGLARCLCWSLSRLLRREHDVRGVVRWSCNPPLK